MAQRPDVFDVRFPEEPYFPEPKCSPWNGSPAGATCSWGPETNEFCLFPRAPLRHVVPKYEQEGKSYPRLPLMHWGCTQRQPRRARRQGTDRRFTRQRWRRRATRGSHVFVGEKPNAGPGIEIATVHRDVARKEAPRSPFEEHAEWISPGTDRATEQFKIVNDLWPSRASGDEVSFSSAARFRAR